MITPGHHPASTRSPQHGAVLMVVLILLVVMALLAVSSMRGTLFEERMSASQIDRGFAFQAAEAALRAGEQLAEGKPALPSSGCNAGLCAIPVPSTTTSPVWEVESNWSSARSVSGSFPNLTSQPKYLVELLTTTAPPPESVTGGSGGSGGTTSIDCKDVGVGCDSSGSSGTGTGSGAGNTFRYRITARVQMDNRATVMLQSIYAVP